MADLTMRFKAGNAVMIMESLKGQTIDGVNLTLGSMTFIM